MELIEGLSNYILNNWADRSNTQVTMEKLFFSKAILHSGKNDEISQFVC